MNARALGRAVAVAAGLATLLLLGGCAQQQEMPTSTVYSTVEVPGPEVSAGPPTPTSPAVDSAFSIQDIVFLQQMLTHHEQASQMVAAAGSRSDDVAVRRHAETVGTALLGEVRQIDDWLLRLGIEPSSGSSSGAHQHGGGMTQEDVDTLLASSGTAFDELFVELMAQHGIGAIELARQQAADGFNVEVIAMAAAIARRESDQVATVAVLR